MTYFLTEQVTSQVENLWHAIRNGLGSGSFLFDTFDSWQGVLGTALDIVVSSFVIYFILKLFNDSRAWQLLKGFLFIIAFTFFCGAMGLTTINYILSNSISVLVIGFVVIFQPELRMALETVGRNSLSILSNVSQDHTDSRWESNMIEAIAVACDNMSRTMTGALIVLERRTGLGELINNSPTALILDAHLTSTALEQVFYKNSPLHDGAVIIRNGRIFAARCHIPLSDTYHLRKDMGTRHRAALGASEIGDAIGIVVSEERGTISITIEGRLYGLENADALRAVLHRLYFNETEKEGEEGNKSKTAQALTQFIQNVKFVATSDRSGSEAEEVLTRDEQTLRKRKLHRLGLKALSVLLSLVLYVYVQTVTNPIETETFRDMPITKEGIGYLDQQGIKMVSSEQTVTLVIRARRNTLEKIRNNPSRIISSIRVPQQHLEVGRFSWKVQVRIQNISSASYEVASIYPLEVPVVLTQDKQSGEESLPGIHRSGSGGISTTPDETEP